MINSAYRLSSDMNHGVWVDVFCLDDAPERIDERRYRKLNRKIRLYRNSRLAYYAMLPSWRFKVTHFAIRCLFAFVNKDRYCRSIENVLRGLPEESKGTCVWPYLIWGLVKPVDKIALYRREWFKDTVMLPFADRLLPCPGGYEEILTAQYGEWRTPVMGTSLHEGVEIDLDRPFSTVVAEKLQRLPWLKRYFYTH